MKKTFTLTSIAALLCLCTVFSGCTKDDIIARRLAGGWEGDWGMSYVDRHNVQHDSHYTVIEFYPEDDFETYGHGYQEDYYQTGPYEKLGFYFTWSVDNGRIHITYPGYSQYNAYIRDYTLSKDHFYGYFGNSDIRFDLSKVWKYYQWYDYAGLYTTCTLGTVYWVGTTRYYYDDYNYAKSRTPNGETVADELAKRGIKPLSDDDNRPVRIFNRYAEKE